MKEKLLIVGQDLIHTKDWLEELEQNFDISIVADGSSAIEKIKNQNEDMIVLLSLVMPRIDGYQVLRAMKSNKKPQKLRIVAMTGVETYQIHLKEFSGLVNETIKKPETRDEMKNLKTTLLLAC